MSLVWQLAWRFRSSKRQNGFISFISASSTIGIALGCFVLILLLSVMNGFEKELKDRLLSVIPHGEVWSVSGQGIENWTNRVESLETMPKVLRAEPYAKATAMLQKGNNMKAVELNALNPDYAKNSSLAARIDSAQWQLFSKQEDTIILGNGVMKKLELEIGDAIQLLLPQLSDDLSLKAPKTLWLTVVGTLSIGGELDNHLAIVRLKTAAKEMNITHGAQGIRVQFHDPFDAPLEMRLIGYGFDQHVFMSDWTRTQGHLYQDIQLVRSVVYLALSLVIAVACFNIVSTLVMAVNEKQAEIAMLKTMGARNNLIIQVFMLQGLLNGLIGTVVGVIAGVLVASNLTVVATFIEKLSGVQFLSGDIYFINFLPSLLNWNEVYLTAIIALVLSFTATIYPAKKASQINPAEVL